MVDNMFGGSISDELILQTLHISLKTTHSNSMDKELDLVNELGDRLLKSIISLLNTIINIT